MLSVFKANSKIIQIALLAVLTILSPDGDSNAETIGHGIITSYRLNLRANPSQNSDVLEVLEKGTRVALLKKDGGIGGWLTIQHNSKTGYVRNRPKYIKLFEVKSAPVVHKKKPGPVVHRKIQEEKKEIQSRLETQEKMVQTFSEKEMEIIEGLNETDYALNRAHLKLSSLTDEIDRLEKRISGLDKEKENLAQELKRNSSYAGKRLRALYKMNMIGRLDALGLPESVFDFFLQQNSMKRVIKSDFRILEEQNRNLEKFDGLEVDLQKEIQAKTKLEEQVKDQVRINQKETLKKEMILRQIRKQKKLSLAAVAALREAQIELDARINDIRQGKSGTVTNTSFPNYKGYLRLPVKGKIISGYGPSNSGDYKAYTFQKGIDIRVERGEPVKSIFKGEVIFSQWLKGYGNLLIINHGENYYSLYAHVEEIFKQKGERVETGEVVATAGDTGSIKGTCLHFELRHHGNPVNPMQWLKKGT